MQGISGYWTTMLYQMRFSWAVAFCWSINRLTPYRWLCLNKHVTLTAINQKKGEDNICWLIQYKLIQKNLSYLLHFETVKEMFQEIAPSPLWSVTLTVSWFRVVLSFFFPDRLNQDYTWLQITLECNHTAFIKHFPDLVIWVLRLLQIFPIRMNFCCPS